MANVNMVVELMRSLTGFEAFQISQTVIHWGKDFNDRLQVIAKDSNSAELRQLAADFASALVEIRKEQDFLKMV